MISIRLQHSGVTVLKKKMEAILHPDRIRILQTLLNGDELTAQQMKQKLTDVSVPTLYRHLNTLADLKIIEVVEENPIRGTVEKVYALPSEDLFSREDIETATPEEHMDYFTMFMLNLLSQFNHYVTSEDSNVNEDKVTYRQIQLQLSKQEIVDMFQIIRQAMRRHIDNQPNDDRQLYSISTIVLPILNE